MIVNICFSWSDFKSLITDKAKLRFIDRGTDYKLDYCDQGGNFECYLLKDSGSDQSDFESNYKSYANKKITGSVSVDTVPPFGSKTIIINGVTKKLFARFTGIQQALSIGANTIDYTTTYPWAKIVGLEIINGEALDAVDLKVYDTAAGTYSGVPNYMLNQFAYTMNVGSGFYEKVAQFDADIYQGMILRFTYNSISEKTVGFNLLINEVKS